MHIAQLLVWLNEIQKKRFLLKMKVIKTGKSLFLKKINEKKLIVCNCSKLMNIWIHRELDLSLNVENPAFNNVNGLALIVLFRPY